MRSATGTEPFFVYLGESARCFHLADKFRQMNIRADVCPYEVFVTIARTSAGGIPQPEVPGGPTDRAVLL